MLVTQCSTLWDPMDCTLPGSSVHGILLSRQEYWSGLPFPSPGNLPDPTIKPRPPALQVDYHLSKKVLVAQSCPTLCDPMDCSPPGSSVHGILQARILEWGAISFSRGSSQPRESKPGLLPCRHVLYWLNYKQSPSHQIKPGEL